MEQVLQQFRDPDHHWKCTAISTVRSHCEEFLGAVDQDFDVKLSYLRQGTLQRAGNFRLEFSYPYEDITRVIYSHSTADDANLAQQYGEFEQLSRTGCLLIHGVLGLACTNQRTGQLSGEAFAALIWVSKSQRIRSKQAKEDLMVFFGADPRYTFLEDGTSYQITSSGYTNTKDMVKNFATEFWNDMILASNTRVMYAINIYDPVEVHAISTSASPLQNIYDGLSMRDFTRELWQRSSDKPHGHSHSLLLIRKGDQCCIVQSYYGYYTVIDWLAFSRNLEYANPLPDPVLAGWRKPLLPKPAMRGVMTMQQAKLLCELLASLICPHPQGHQRAYAELTGVQMDPATMPTRFRLQIQRLNLDRLLLV
jgi:hypothetical protein